MILISAIIIIKWIEHVFRYLHDEILLEFWNLRQIYTRDKLNHLASRLRIEDRSLLKRANNIFLSLNYHEDASTTLIITIRDCYFQHVDKLFVQKTHFKWTFKSRIMINKMSMNFVWDRVCIDEAHQEQKLNNEAVLIFKKIDFHVRKWFLTKTSFENFLDQMTSWVQVLQLSWDRNLISSTNSWSRLEQYRLQLNDCTFDKIKTLSDIHKRFVKFNVENKTKLFNYIEKLSIVLNTLWLRRTIDQSRFFDQSLTDVLLNIHQSILCSLSNHLRKVVNSQVKTITRQLKNELIDAMIKWKKSIIKMTSKSKMNINSWFIMIRRMRILSIFSRLRILSKTKSLLFIEQENMKNEWITLRKNRLYELQKVNSSYELHLNDICSVDNCFKIIAINELITLKWIKNEKIVFTTMKSTNALILYWMNRQ